MSFGHEIYNILCKLQLCAGNEHDSTTLCGIWRFSYPFLHVSVVRWTGLPRLLFVLVQDDEWA